MAKSQKGIREPQQCFHPQIPVCRGKLSLTLDLSLTYLSLKLDFLLDWMSETHYYLQGNCSLFSRILCLLVPLTSALSNICLCGNESRCTTSEGSSGVKFNDENAEALEERCHTAGIDNKALIPHSELAGTVISLWACCRDWRHQLNSRASPFTTVS